MRGLIIVAMGGGILLGTSMAALASVEVGDIFTINYAQSGTQQGPFSMQEWPHGTTMPLGPSGRMQDDYNTRYGTTTYSTSEQNNFTTFCAEQGEWFYPGERYMVVQLGEKSVLSNMYLTPYAAWLFTMYATDQMPTGWGTLGTSHYNMLQKAIWAGMIEDMPSSNSYLTQVGTDHSEYVLSTADWNWLNDNGIGITAFQGSTWYQGGAGLGNVQVMVLAGKIPSDSSSTGPDRAYPDEYQGLSADGYGYAQDQLVLGEGPFQPVSNLPEPTSLLIWGVLGLGGGILGLRVWGGRRGDPLHGAHARPAWTPEAREAIYRVVHGETVHEMEG